MTFNHDLDLWLLINCRLYAETSTFNITFPILIAFGHKVYTLYVHVNINISWRLRSMNLTLNHDLWFLSVKILLTMTLGILLGISSLIWFPGRELLDQDMSSTMTFDPDLWPWPFDLSPVKKCSSLYFWSSYQIAV